MCANRELYEESKTTLLLRDMLGMLSYTYMSSWRSKEHKKVDKSRGWTVVTKCTVFMVKLHFTAPKELTEYVTMYKKNTIDSHKRAYNETNDVAFFTARELTTNKRVWEYMANEIVPKILDALYTSKLP